MSFVYTPALGLLDAATLTGDVRAALLMSNTTGDTDTDAATISAIGTLDEYDGASYARVALTTEAWAAVLATDRFKFSADPIVFATLGVGTRQCVGLLIFLFVTNDTDSKPLMYIDGTGFPFDGNGANVTFTPHADGVMYTRNAP